MSYVLTSEKTVDQAALDLESAVKQNGFGVLHQYDLKQTLKSKGYELPTECRILEICNPAQATAVLAADISMNMALPCRVSVYEEGGETKIGMIPPTEVLGLLSTDETLAKTAVEVEEAIKEMMQQAV